MASRPEESAAGGVSATSQSVCRLSVNTEEEFRAADAPIASLLRTLRRVEMPLWGAWVLLPFLARSKLFDNP